MKKLFLIVLIAGLSAQLSAAQFYVNEVTPRGGQRGKTVDVVFSGSNLEDPQEIMFYDAGLAAEGIEIVANTVAKDAPKDQPKKGPTKVKARLKIAADCRIGEHLLRLRTARAVCEAVTFWVGPFPVIDEVEKKPGDNDDVANAEAVPLNCTVHGQLVNGDNGPDRDCYRVNLKKGQRLSVEVEGVRLGTVHFGTEFDLMARVLDAEGTELAVNDNNPLFIQDPVLSILAPKDGVYIVEISQAIYVPTNAGYYRAHIGTFTRPMAVYPLGGQAGQKLDVQALGDPSGTYAQSVQLPAQAGDFGYFAQKDNDPPPPSPNTLRVSSYPNVLEVEPNDTPETATLVPSLPAALNGVIAQKGDADYFRFHAEKGQTWRVMVFAQALGTPLDARMYIKPLENPSQNLIDKDDSSMMERGLMHASGRWRLAELVDPTALFTAPKTGDYLLKIEDSRGLGGPMFVYRIEIEAVVPRITAYMSFVNNYNYQYYYRLDIPAGGTFTRNFTIAPNLGTTLKGEYELEAAGLPEGVTMSAPKFTPGATTQPVIFNAAAGAKLAGAFVKFRVKSLDPAQKFESDCQQGFAFQERQGGYAWHTAFADKLAVGVIEGAPFSIELAQPDVSLIQSGELNLKYTIHRKDSFKGAVEVRCDWTPSGVTAESRKTLPATESEGKFTLSAAAKAAPGKFQMALTAMSREVETEYGVGTAKVASKFVELRVAEPYLSVVIPRASVQRGKQASVTCELKQLRDFAGEATAELKRLPHGISLVQPLPKFTAKDSKITFTLACAEEALLGQYRDIFCEVTLTENGQPMREQSGSGVLRIDTPKGVKTTAAN